MPERYDKIRDDLMKNGMQRKDAEREAAKTYQRTRGPGEMELNAAVKAEKRAERAKRLPG